MSQRPSLEQITAAGPEQLTALLDCARELLAILTAEGTVLHASAGSIRALGLRPEELMGRSLAEFIHPEDLGEMGNRLHGIASSANQTQKNRCRLRSITGEWRWFEATISNCLSNPTADGIVASFLDVTALQRMESERQVISEIVHALNQTANLDQLLDGIHQALKKVLYAENCFIALHNPNEDTFYFPFFADQFDTAPPPQKLGRSCTAYVFRTGGAMLIPQSEFDRLAQQGKVELVGSPSPAWLGVPLKTPRATIGVLVVQHYQNENAYDIRDLEFLDSVGGHIALAIERRRSEEALRKSESVFRLLFSHNPLPTWVVDDETLTFIQVNDAAVKQYGYAAEEFARMSMFDIRPEEKGATLEVQPVEDAKANRYQGVCKHRKKDGKVFEVEMISHQLDYAGRRVRLVVAQDISERHILEQQLRQAQKFEAIGQLAGGIAHDFNNVVGAILGWAELGFEQSRANPQVAERFSRIREQADRAAALTRELLAFARRQVLQPRAVDLNTVAGGLVSFLDKVISKDIEIKVITAPLDPVKADPAQIEQVLMNLCINARDAMPNGGRLLMETEMVEFDDSYCRFYPQATPGRYVVLSVSDTGIGMDTETRERIFEPFFTTKEPGKGTGMGLATVYGIIKQHGGLVHVYSEPGQGSLFRVYLPVMPETVGEGTPSQTPANYMADTHGTETILLAEDHEAIREMSRQTLAGLGYRVLAARDGEEALVLCEKEKPAMAILDVVMPNLGGPATAAKLAMLFPGLPVLFTSGYSQESKGITAVASESRYLQKPYSPSALGRLVREILDTSKMEAPPASS